MKPWKRILLIGFIVAITSQFYFNILLEGFRVSAAVILFPVLLMTMGKDQKCLKLGVVTGITVFILRFVIYLGADQGIVHAAREAIHGALFYLFYAMLFGWLVKDRYTVPLNRLFISVFICDLASNIFEIMLQSLLQLTGTSLDGFPVLAVIALARTGLASVIFMGEKHYRILLTKEEHENRYQRLFLMTTSLKNEVYFMKKNSEEIESVMSNAYRLYEKLSELGVPEETKRMSLAIARDVHEIKKDYLRIMQGIENEIGAEGGERMSLQDLFKILKDSTYQILKGRELSVTLDFICGDDFTTKDHYMLMAILKNLVNNAIEAIESSKKQGIIRIREYMKDGKYQFEVTDDGPGISERHLPHIFQMGYSTKFDYKTGNIYRGVGLSGVKMAVEEHFGGSIDVESQVGRGTRFLIVIPADALEGE